MHHVYFLESLKKPTRPYTGETNNLQRRLAEHNEGIDKHSYTYIHRPWEMVCSVLTDTRETARVVELHFKSRSGREKFKRYAERHPESKNPINDFFNSLDVGRGFGKRANNSRFKVIENNGTPIFAMDKG